MPVYAWKGLDQAGQVRRGTLLARSLADLKALLLKHNIGLIAAHKPLLARTISAQQRALFFSQMGSLLSAHITVHQALQIIAAMTQNSLKAVVTDCAAFVAEGRPLSEACHIHGLADELAYSMLIVGEKTGNLATVLVQLAEHMTAMTLFKNKVRAAVRSPALTFCFFITLMLSIGFFVIPRFEIYFRSANAQLPTSTQVVLTVSGFMRSLSFVYLLLALFALILCLKPLLRVAKIGIIRFIPLSGFVWRARFFSNLGTLLKNGIPIHEALQTVENSFKHAKIRKEIQEMRHQVDAGQPFSKSFKESIFYAADIEACLVIGENSGALADMISHVGSLYRQKAYICIEQSLTLLNPLLILLLGTCIAGLIFALYMPLLSLSILL